MARFSWIMARAVAENWVRKTVLGQHVPAALHIEVTTECQLKCKGCYVTERPPHRWTAPDLSQLIGEAESLGIRQFSLTGGEPLIEADTIITVAKEHSSSAFLVVSNGILINGALIGVPSATVRE